MNCPTCGLAFDPTRGLRCPRCNESLDCGAVDCGECGACSGVVADLRSLFRRADEVESSADADTP